MIFERIDDNGCISYLIGSETERVAAVVDPAFQIEKYQDLLKKHGLKLQYAIDTHNHADHRSGSKRLAEEMGVTVVVHKNAAHQRTLGADLAAKIGILDIVKSNNEGPINVAAEDGQVLKVGEIELKILHTSGHTSDSLCIQLGDKILTGDTLLIGQPGRMDLPGGNKEEMYNSLFNKLLKFPDATEIYPGHEYNNRVKTTIGFEKANNDFLKVTSKDAFVEFANNFFPPLIQDSTGCATGKLMCGTVITPVEEMDDHVDDPSVIVISPDEVVKNRAKYYVIDVREPFELVQDGMIEGAVNIPLNTLPRALDQVPNDRLVVINCRSGGRSDNATHFLRSKGFTNVKNLQGGIGLWKMKAYPLVKPSVR